MRYPLVAAFLIITVNAHAYGPSTKANDDSCDIALVPAATLLLPYFEVDVTDPQNQTTLFSITNVTNEARIARVTLWTDFSYPVLTFNIYLTGYDVQSISLFDVISRGIIGGGSGTGTSASPVGPFSDANTQLDLTSCANLPGAIPPAFVARMQEAFTRGIVRGMCDEVGNAHENAVGYATIDVVGNCSSAMPADPEYFANDIRYDNVLVGDYQQVSGRLQHVQMSPLVHIRAIPEGGTPISRAQRPGTFANRFSRTFYGRFQSASMFNSDARQPLPSRFAVRWINNYPEYFTSFKIWRQSATGRDLTCRTLDDNNHVPMTDSVVFDEDENAEGLVLDDPCSVDPVCTEQPVRLPTTSNVGIGDLTVFPQSMQLSRRAGWLYLNLDDRDTDNGAHQNWIVVSMTAGAYSGDMDGLALGNGCSHPVERAEASQNGPVVIGPSPNGEPEP
jgi:hypothetical protein